jgi:putative transposase
VAKCRPQFICGERRIKSKMSFWRTYYHLTWSTKNRASMITSEIEPRLVAYLVRKASEFGVYVFAINGWNDHIHMVVAIPPKIAVADLVKNLKGASSHYVNQEIRLEYEFAWQRGYGVLTVGERQKHIAIEYVQNQKIHHSSQTENTWLERFTDLEDGPTEPGLTSDGVPHVVRESVAGYDVTGDILI